MPLDHSTKRILAVYLVDGEVIVFVSYVSIMGLPVRYLTALICHSNISVSFLPVTPIVMSRLRANSPRGKHSSPSCVVRTLSLYRINTLVGMDIR